MATDRDPGTAAASGASDRHRWTVTAALRRHPRISAGGVALVVALIVVTLMTSVSSPKRQPITDAATCSQWAAATPAQKIAYAHIYIEEYGAFANTDARAAAIEQEIDKACTHASYLGEADDLSVLAGMRHAF